MENETLSEALENARRDIWAAVEGFRESGVHLGLFDSHVLVQLDWLAAQTDTPEHEIRGLVDDGTLPRRTGADGDLGFTIFTEAQIRFIKELRKAQRLTEDEIRHVIWYENQLLEHCWLAVVPYDDHEMPDLEHFKRRIAHEIDEIRELEEFNQSSRGQGLAIVEDMPRTLNRLAEQRIQFEKMANVFRDKTEGELTEGQIRFYKKMLYRLRWIDEWTLAHNVTEFEAKIRQGYSPELLFKSWSSDGQGHVEFGEPDWTLTLEAYQDSRSRGKRFPLRTPDFCVSETGLTIGEGTTPDRYSEIFQHYRLDELSKAMANLGQKLWNPAELPSGMERCAACSRVFESDNPKRRYCSEKCRERAKRQRWRTRDPEGARMAQARYWIKSYPELLDEEDV